MKKAKGSLIIQYYEEWPLGTDWYMDDDGCLIDDIDGTILLDPEAVYVINQFGSICWQGPSNKTPDDTVLSFEKEFNRWLRSKKLITVFTIEVEDKQNSVNFVRDELASLVVRINKAYGRDTVSLSVTVGAVK